MIIVKNHSQGIVHRRILVRHVVECKRAGTSLIQNKRYTEESTALKKHEILVYLVWSYAS